MTPLLTWYGGDTFKLLEVNRFSHVISYLMSNPSGKPFHPQTQVSSFSACDLAQGIITTLFLVIENKSKDFGSFRKIEQERKMSSEKYLRSVLLFSVLNSWKNEQN